MASRGVTVQRLWSPRRGFSLLELMVGMALVGLVGFIGLSLIIPTARSFSRTTTRADLSQQALVVSNRLTADLARVTLVTTRIHPSGGAADPLVIGMVPLVDVAPDGQQVWGRTLVAYIWYPARERIIRRVWSRDAAPQVALDLVLDGQVPRAPSEADLLKLAAPESLPGDQLLASHVKLADLRGSGSLPFPAVELPLRLRLRLEAWSSQGSKPEVVEMSHVLLPRNTSQHPEAKPTTPVR